MQSTNDPLSSCAECECLQDIAAKQRRFWLTLLIWCLGAVIFAVVTTQLIPRVPPTLIKAVFYGSSLCLYFPARQVFRVTCPHCRGPVGAVPVFRYRFLICKSCGERIECPD